MDCLWLQEMDIHAKRQNMQSAKVTSAHLKAVVVARFKLLGLFQILLILLDFVQVRLRLVALVNPPLHESHADGHNTAAQQSQQCPPMQEWR